MYDLVEKQVHECWFCLGSVGFYDWLICFPLYEYFIQTLKESGLKQSCNFLWQRVYLCDGKIDCIINYANSPNLKNGSYTFKTTTCCFGSRDLDFTTKQVLEYHRLLARAEWVKMVWTEHWIRKMAIIRLEHSCAIFKTR